MSDISRVTISEDDGTVFTCQSSDSDVIVTWMGWYIQYGSNGNTRVGIGHTFPEVSHERPTE